MAWVQGSWKSGWVGAELVCLAGGLKLLVDDMLDVIVLRLSSEFHDVKD